MIIFHEGLPGSGKSYEAAINQIIPALLKGRVVFAYIEGLNHEKFAEVTGLPLPIIQNLLRQLTKEQVKAVQVHVANDSMVIIDELQDFFPSGKATLDSGITEFVTQHRHRGIDIIAMGQDHRDCHMLWKRRIDQLITFVKRDAVGMPDSYTWTTFKQQSGKFKQLRSGKGTYDKKYFGLYASHSEGVSSIDAHKDDRTNIFKSAVFTFYIPLFLVVLCFSGYYLYGFLTGRSSPVKVTTTVVTRPYNPTLEKEPPKVVPVPVPVPAKVEDKEPTKEPKAREYADFIERYLSEYRPRLSGLVVASKGGRILARIDFYTAEKRVYESFSVKQIQEFGYTVEVKTFGLLLIKGGKQYPLTSWPLDIERNVPESKNEELGGRPL